MDFVLARRNMIDGQLRPNQVLHPAVLDALERVPRERFVPADRRAMAYSDEAVPLGDGRYLMEPMVLGRLLQAARPLETDRVLVIGAGTGFSTAILSHVVAVVVGLESDRRLAEQARTNLEALGMVNAAIVEGPLAGGQGGKGAWSLVVIDGAVSTLPRSITETMTEDGRLVAVLGGGRPGVTGQAVIGRMSGGIYSSRVLFDAGTPELPGFAVAAGFVF